MTAPARDPAADLELIHEVFGQPWNDQEARFREWFGWRPSQALPCPRTAAGKRCQHGRLCMCQRFAFALLDHARMWLDENGRRVYTAEPYEFDGTEFAELVTECAGLGLDVCVDGTSPYFPGRTVLIIIRKADDGDNACPHKPLRLAEVRGSLGAAS